MNMYRNSENTD